MTRAITLAGYTLLVAAAITVEIRARSRGQATFGDVVASVLRHRWLRLTILAAWLWLGWHLFVRVTWQ